jgi:MoxR-like ATPase
MDIQIGRDVNIESDKDINNEIEDEINSENDEELDFEKQQNKQQEKTEKEIDIQEEDEKKLSLDEVNDISEKISDMKKELSKIIVGQEEIINSLLRALICKGHVIVEGVPGMAKTLIVRSLATISGCSVNRIQFTVDLLPTDIIGLTIYRKEKGFETIKGPIFTNFVIADEINRAPPKTQSALLEAMQEKEVTIGKKTYSLPDPFFVMATQNPLEQAGVYTLPEAQIDRFIFKIIVNYPKKKEEKQIMKKNVNLKKFKNFGLKRVISKKDILQMQKKVNEVYLSEEIQDYIVDIVDATRDKNKDYSKYIDWGASPRASINFFIASKAEALMQGRNYVIPEDVKKISIDVLRHRLILNYEAEAENITSDILIKKIISEISLP